MGYDNTKALGLDIYGGVDCVGTCVIEFYIDHIVFYLDTLTLRWKHYGVYACIPSRAIISDSDGTSPSTRVYAVRCASAPAAMSYLIK
jgi:hypothetical protein